MKAERLCLDIINTLPKGIIETILCCIPIKDAARTSILSRNWRFKFIKEDFEVTSDDENHMNKRFKILYAIYQILIVHHGPVHEFTLSMDADDTCFEIVRIILSLSRNYKTLNKFTLDLRQHCWYRIPSSIFLLDQLTDLYLHRGYFDHDSTTSNGFGSLTTLYLDRVIINTDELLHLISHCPLLKSATLILYNKDLYQSGGDTIFELFECLHVIEHLSISHYVIECFAEDAVIPRELPTSLIYLKSFCFEDMCFSDKYGLPFLLLLIRCSPSLEKIKLQIYRDGDDKKSEIKSVDYSDICLDHLNELEIKNLTNLKEEMEFVKGILARSPVLKKVNMLLRDNVPNVEELKMLRILLRFPHASPLVDIIVEHPIL